MQSPTIYEFGCESSHGRPKAVTTSLALQMGFLVEVAQACRSSSRMRTPLYPCLCQSLHEVSACRKSEVRSMNGLRSDTLGSNSFSMYRWKFLHSISLMKSLERLADKRRTSNLVLYRHEAASLWIRDLHAPLDISSMDRSKDPQVEAASNRS